MKTHTFNGRVHDITLEACDGYCDEPYPKRPSLYVAMNDLSPTEQLRVAIHEALHACDWDKSEEQVDQTSRDIGRFLWRLGYRKVE